MVDLKCCPFCGSEQIATAPSRINLWVAMCKACAASVEHSSEAETIAAWNTRTPSEPADVDERVEELKFVILSADEEAVAQELDPAEEPWAEFIAKAVLAALSTKAVEVHSPKLTDTQCRYCGAGTGDSGCRICDRGYYG